MPSCSNASATCRCGFDLPARERELTEARAASAAPDLWDEPKRAQALMKRVARLERQVETWQSLERRSADLEELTDLAAETEGEEREALQRDIKAELGGLEAQFGELEVALTLGGPYDDHSAVLAIHAGAGGTEAQDWAEMLLRLYLRWGERHGYGTQIVSVSSGDEAGIKSVSNPRRRRGRLRAAALGARRAPAGADLALRRLELAAHELRAGGGAAGGGGRRHRDRDPA